MYKYSSTNVENVSNETKRKSFSKGNDDYFSLAEVASYLDISVSGVKQKIREGAFRSYKPSAKLVYVKLSELKDWIENSVQASWQEIDQEAESYILNSKFVSLKMAA